MRDDMHSEDDLVMCLDNHNRNFGRVIVRFNGIHESMLWIRKSWNEQSCQCS